MREVFVDESSQTGHNFMVQGALIVPGQEVQPCERAILAVLKEAAMLGEVKWTKVSRSKLPTYRRIVAEYFRRVAAHRSATRRATCSKTWTGNIT